jgi:hypothetical protein
LLVYPIVAYSYAMRSLRYSINVTLEGGCDHRAMFADEDLHRHAVENLAQGDAHDKARLPREAPSRSVTAGASKVEG